VILVDKDNLSGNARKYQELNTKCFANTE